jgi:cysteinyl-tRNA synthetase
MIAVYNTLTRRKMQFRPFNEGKVGIYTCGPTLHDLAHIGLIRRLLAVDILKKVLQHDGYQVRHIVNLTDIDDKTIGESARRGQRLDELTDHYATEFYSDMATLRMFPADHYPRATEHVDEMVEMTRELARAGSAYEMRRSVYFDISSFRSYGKLSRVDLSKIRSGATVDLDYYEKDNPRDFTLMRRSDLAELRRRITYKTEWGNVRPGWHIECAAMAAKYLGLPFDIHTSGQDLVFPHNENENVLDARGTDAASRQEDVALQRDRVDSARSARSRIQRESASLLPLADALPQAVRLLVRAARCRAEGVGAAQRGDQEAPPGEGWRRAPQTGR